MRFVFPIIWLALAAPLSAQPGQTFKRPADTQTPNTQTSDPSVTYNTHAPLPALQKQVRGPHNTLQTREDLQLSEIATGLGDVSALILEGKGDILALDKSRGRLYRLTDRGGDGRIDNRLPIAATFESPSGLAQGQDKDMFFVADKTAIWQLNSRGEKNLFVSLENAKALPNAPRPLLYDETNARLLIGLNFGQTSPEHSSKIIAIDMKTKAATELESYAGLLTSLALSPSGEIWVGVAESLHVLGRNTQYPLEAAVRSFILPNTKTPKNWPAFLKDHIIISQSATSQRGTSNRRAVSQQVSGGVNIVSLPTVFGTPTDTISVLIDGFLSQRGHAAWGQPTSMAIDERGLFFVDSWQGSLWRLWPEKPKVKAKVKAPDIIVKDTPIEDLKDVDIAASVQTHKQPLLLGSQIQGSQIKGSQITRATTLPFGSQQIRDFNSRKNQEEEKEDKEKSTPR